MTKTRLAVLLVFALFLGVSGADAHEYLPTRANFLKNLAPQIKNSGGGVILIGDSLTDGLWLPEIKGMQVFNAGIGSNNLDGALQYGVQLAKESGAKVAVVCIGVNDASRHQDFSVSEWARRYERLLSELTGAGIKVYASTILPVESGKGLGDAFFDPERIRQMNDAIREIAEQRSISLIDSNAAFAGPDGAMPKGMTVDGVHLSLPAYDKWRALLIKSVDPGSPVE